MPVYVIKKYIEADTMQQALKKEQTIKVHECWLHEDSTRGFIEDIKKKDERKLGFH